MTHTKRDCASPLSEVSSISFSPLGESKTLSDDNLLIFQDSLEEEYTNHNNHELGTNPTEENDLIQPYLYIYDSVLDSSPEKELISQCEDALKYNLYPLEVYEGVTGAFLMKKRGGGFAAVFKPEECLSRRCSFYERDNRVEQAVREVAAYLLDHHSFANIPRTLFVRIRSQVFQTAPKIMDYPSVSPKLETKHSPQLTKEADTCRNNDDNENKRWLVGSLQSFIRHNCDAYDVSCTFFKKEQVHQLGIFDVRTLNTDRHEGNVLVQFKNEKHIADGVTLVPIDHAVILPDYENINVKGNFCWMLWPQSKVQFDDYTKDYIRKLDPIADKVKLIGLLGHRITEKSILSLFIGTSLLKIGVLEFNLSLFDIGELIVGDFSLGLTEEDTKSPLLQVIDMTKEYIQESPERAFMVEFEENLRAEIVKRSHKKSV